MPSSQRLRAWLEADFDLARQVEEFLDRFHEPVELVVTVRVVVNNFEPLAEMRERVDIVRRVGLAVALDIFDHLAPHAGVAFDFEIDLLEIDIRDFFHSFYTTELATDEILAEIDIPLPKRGVRFAFQEFSRQRGAFAIAMAAVSFTPGDGSPGKLDAVLGGCGPRPVRLELGTLQADASLDQHVAEILDRASLTPTNDVHASAEDRRTIASSLLVGCVTELLHPTSQRGH